ncbi:hypothetical protein VTL71DRAFT_11160 [Oculimacula yallundae]|uniref:Uncharacterized protein n=1 Tax=Oculimacula yallundae TaxID=86028 RepID=A0ABR4CXP9_9HELO
MLDVKGWGHPVVIVEAVHEKDTHRISFVKMSSYKREGVLPNERPVWEKLSWRQQMETGESNAESLCLFHVPHVYTLVFSPGSPEILEKWNSHHGPYSTEQAMMSLASFNELLNLFGLIQTRPAVHSSPQQQHCHNQSSSTSTHVSRSSGSTPNQNPVISTPIVMSSAVAGTSTWAKVAARTVSPSIDNARPQCFLPGSDMTLWPSICPDERETAESRNAQKQTSATSSNRRKINASSYVSALVSSTAADSSTLAAREQALSMAICRP